MTFRDHTVDLAAFDDEAADACRRAAEGEPVIVTDKGRPVAAVVSATSLLALERDRQLLRRLALGELESAAGEGDELEAVIAECRLLLEES